MKIAALFSGGKDSCLALQKAKKFHDVACLVTLISENKESYMFHTPNIKLTKLQAKAMQIPIMQIKTKGEKEKELEDLKKALIMAKKRFKIKGVATGAIRSIYQASRIQKICKELNLWCFNPLWLNNQMELLNDLIKEKFEVIISGIFAFPLDEEFLGKQIDKRIIEKLGKLQERYQLNPSGEGGEIETTVLDAPLFKKKIEILDFNIKYKDNAGIFKIKKAKLIKKHQK